MLSSFLQVSKVCSSGLAFFLSFALGSSLDCHPSSPAVNFPCSFSLAFCLLSWHAPLLNPKMGIPSAISRLLFQECYFDQSIPPFRIQNLTLFLYFLLSQVWTLSLVLNPSVKLHLKYIQLLVFLSWFLSWLSVEVNLHSLLSNSSFFSPQLCHAPSNTVW